MKKIIILILIISFGKKGFGQWPIIQNLGSDSTLIRIGPTYNGGIKGGLINMTFVDTSAANLSRISQYAGSQIFTTSDTSFWIRNKTTTNLYWFKVGGAGGGAAGNFWPLGYRQFPVVYAAFPPKIGTGAAGGGSDFTIGTNGVDRLVFLNSGIPYVNDTSANKVLTINSSTKALGYSSWFGSGGGGGSGFTTANNGLTASTATNVQLGGTLVNATTAIDVAGNTFRIDNGARRFFIVDGASGDQSMALDVDDASENEAVMELHANSGEGAFFSIESSKVTGTRFVSVTGNADENTLTLLSNHDDDGKQTLVTLYSDSLYIEPNEGKINIFSLRDATNENRLIGWQNSTGRVGAISLGAGLSLSSGVLNTSGTVATPISSLTAATGTNTINNGASLQEWQWNTLAGTSGLKLSSTSTAASGNAQIVFEVTTTGVNASSSQNTKGISVSNTHSGTSSDNTGITSTATGGTSSNTGVIGVSNGTTSKGVYGINSTAGSQTGQNTSSGVYGYASASGASNSVGVFGYSLGNTGKGVYGYNDATGYGGYFENQGVTGTGYALYAIKQGAATTNIAAQFQATQATNNYAIIVPVSSGTVGIGTSSPTSLLHVLSVQTTGIGAEFISSTTTSGTILDLTGTSTALAANNEAFNIAVSGANGTNAITATGARISVTNTNATSGTNEALNLTASGATTANNAINIVAGAIALNGSAGTSGQVLTSAGVGTLPTWSTPSAGGSPGGGYGAIQGNRNSAFSGLGDSLVYTTAAGLTIKNSINITTAATAQMNVQTTAGGEQAQVRWLTNSAIWRVMVGGSSSGFSGSWSLREENYAQNPIVVQSGADGNGVALGMNTALHSGANATLFVTGSAVGIGNSNTAPVASALLEMASTAKGLLPPRMTTTQKNAISSPAEGLVIYDLTLHKLCIFTGTVWETVTSL